MYLKVHLTNHSILKTLIGEVNNIVTLLKAPFSWFRGLPEEVLPSIPENYPDGSWWWLVKHGEHDLFILHKYLFCLLPILFLFLKCWFTFVFVFLHLHVSETLSLFFFSTMTHNKWPAVGHQIMGSAECKCERESVQTRVGIKRRAGGYQVRGHVLICSFKESSLQLSGY